MKVGEIYDGFFKYEDSNFVKHRPFLVLQVDRTKRKAIICKITTSYPSMEFPHRVPILQVAASRFK